MVDAVGFFFFFFQAEDGIRDGHVTGVQTCALPIWGRVFALYDMLFNVPFVVGAVVAAQIIPVTGKSYLLIAVAAAGYLLAAVAYATVSRQELLAGPDSAGPSPAGSSRSAAPPDARGGFPGTPPEAGGGFPA